MVGLCHLVTVFNEVMLKVAVLYFLVLVSYKTQKPMSINELIEKKTSVL